MCGRYSITASRETIEHRFHATFASGLYKPTWNAAPSQQLPIIHAPETEKIELATWGFLPEHWESRHLRPQNNARIETAAQKPTFAAAYTNRHCLILCDGFFEWKSEGKSKQPYRFTRKDGAPFALAGIYSRPDLYGRGLSFAILTTTANACMAPVHDRMPVVLQPGAEHAWLYGGSNMFVPPFPAELMTCYPVTPLMNKASFNVPEAIAPLPNGAASLL
jgi:putative SOS response-associated peptidase YedK